MSQPAVSPDKRPALAFDAEHEARALIEAIDLKQKTLKKQGGVLKKVQSRNRNQDRIEYFDKLKSQLRRVTWLFQYGGLGD
jgi:hypothetical protein